MPTPPQSPAARPAKPAERSFSANGMATRWEIFVEASLDPDLALRATTAVFAEMTRLEGFLSHFVANSEIGQINAAGGQFVVVNPDTWDVLKAAEEMCRSTDHAFDPCFASPREALDAVREGGAFEFDTVHHVVRLRDPRLKVGLGAIGKGYALDRMGTLLEAEWEIRSAMLHGGGSTVLALDAPKGRGGWPVTLQSAQGRDLVRLSRVAISASGFDVKGAHIVDPRTGKPALTYIGTWSRAPSATVADALSTAFAVMSPEEVERWVAGHPGTGARLVLEREGRREMLSFGVWPVAETPVPPPSGQETPP